MAECLNSQGEEIGSRSKPVRGLRFLVLSGSECAGGGVLCVLLLAGLSLLLLEGGKQVGHSGMSQGAHPGGELWERVPEPLARHKFRLRRKIL